MFACTSFSTLPQNDPKAKKYACGAEVLDACGIGCIAVCAVVLVYLSGSSKYTLTTKMNEAESASPTVAVAVAPTPENLVGAQLLSRLRLGLTMVNRYLFGTSIVGEFSANLSESEREEHAVMDYAAELLGGFRFMCALLMAMILLLFLPVTSLLKLSTDQFSSQTYQYAWVVSVGFLSGSLPGILIAMLWLLVLLFTLLYEHRYIDRRTRRFFFLDTLADWKVASTPQTSVVKAKFDFFVVQLSVSQSI
jgi:hypothetical protein